MTDKQIKDDVSNFCLVCYYDNRTNELVRVEHYEDNSGDMKSDIDSYKYGYNAEIIKPEEIIKQLKRSEAQCEAMFVSHTDLEKKYKVKEQECERLKDIIETKLEDANICDSALNYINDEYIYVKRQLDRLKGELKSAKELREYTYNCCKQAGEELAKNSFEWDGKEKNLVVQAMELNERYDQLKVVNERLKNAVMLKCPQCGEVYLDPMGCELYEENEELKEQFKLAEPLYRACNIKDAKINKLKQTLTEIKEIAEDAKTKVFVDMEEFWKQILQKISECESNQ